MANGQVTVDPTALQKLGNNLKTSAANVGGKTADVQGWKFGSAQAGRDYAAEGKKVGDALGRIGTWLQNWQTAVNKMGTQASTSANTYATVDDANVKKITVAGVNL